MSDSAVRAYAAEKRFGAATLERWLTQPAPDRDALLELAARLRLSENQLRDMLDDLVAIAARRGCGLAAILTGEELQAVLARPLGRNEAIKALKRQTRRLRYPQLSAAQDRLAALGRQLALPAGVELALPEHLEGEHISLTLRGRSATELRSQAGAVAAALQDPAIEEMFTLLDGEW